MCCECSLCSMFAFMNNVNCSPFDKCVFLSTKENWNFQKFAALCINVDIFEITKKIRNTNVSHVYEDLVGEYIISYDNLVCRLRVMFHNF